MKRTPHMLLVISLFMNALPPRAEAQGFIGEFCFAFVEFNDRMKIAVTANGSHFELHGRLVANTYQFAVSGAAYVRSDGTVEFSLQGPTGPDSGLKPLSLLRANLNSVTLAGPVTIRGIGDGLPFSNSGTLRVASCAAGDQAIVGGSPESAFEGKGKKEHPGRRCCRLGAGHVA